MSIQIPAGTLLRVETHHDGSLTLRFDRKRPLDPETTPIEETENADVTADVTAVADDAATTFTLKRHKTDVFSEKMALAKTLVALQGNDARTSAIERMFIARCEEQPGDHLLEQHRKYFFTISPQRGHNSQKLAWLPDQTPKRLWSHNRLTGSLWHNSQKLAWLPGRMSKHWWWHNSQKLAWLLDQTIKHWWSRNRSNRR